LVRDQREIAQNRKGVFWSDPGPRRGTLLA
jgi:hypothetical protein